jgi:hypothetical protein
MRKRRRTYYYSWHGNLGLCSNEVEWSTWPAKIFFLVVLKISRVVPVARKEKWVVSCVINGNRNSIIAVHYSLFSSDWSEHEAFIYLSNKVAGSGTDDKLNDKWTSSAVSRNRSCKFRFQLVRAVCGNNKEDLPITSSSSNENPWNSLKHICARMQYLSLLPAS